MQALGTYIPLYDQFGLNGSWVVPQKVCLTNPSFRGVSMEEVTCPHPEPKSNKLKLKWICMPTVSLCLVLWCARNCWPKWIICTACFVPNKTPQRYIHRAEQPLGAYCFIIVKAMEILCISQGKSWKKQGVLRFTYSWSPANRTEMLISTACTVLLYCSRVGLHSLWTFFFQLSAFELQNRTFHYK